ncbi:MAG: carbohydrate ABC transporter permease [Hungatella sp.]|jgi:raffinose/stachyose/melibiose transport system permease protein|nr:carbohydrate ABC transporter permease [Hungatella sp.]MDR2022967.1 carbohydrate ABC transporter permease [Hungatella sp.]
MKKIKLSQVVIQAGLIFWAVLQIFPLFWLLTFSLKDNTDIFQGNMIGLPKIWHFENYAHAFMGGNVGRYLVNSIIVTTATIMIVCMASLMASYALIRMKWRLRKLFQMMFIMGITIPIHAALLPVFIMMRQAHLINTYWCLIIPYSAFAVPMAIMISSGFITSIPVELEEAACIDGCSIYKIFIRIILPLMKPSLSTIAIFTFLQSWNELMFAVVFISKPVYRTLTVGIQSLVGQYTTDWGPIGAGLVVATFPIIIIYVILSKQVQQSLIAGSVKG